VSLREDLAIIVGAEFSSDDPDVLDRYSRDFSFVQPRRPSAVCWPKNTEEVQKVVKFANERSLPVVPRSSKVSFNGAGVPSQGGIVVDVSRLNKVLEIDPRNKKIKLEPGVTWAQVTEAAAKKGMMVCNPLLPHKDKSVLTTHMEREPILITKTEYSEVLATAELVLPNGDMYWTGTALGKGMKGQNFPDALIPGTRLWLGAQGTLGIMTWANLKAEHLPSMDKLYFIPFTSLEKAEEPIYQIQRRMLGNECFILNAFDLAAMVATDFPAGFNTLRQNLPPWTLVLCLTGLDRMPEEKIAYEEEALMEIARTLHFQPSHTVGGVPGLEGAMLKMLRKPWEKDIYWKQQFKGANQDIFFHTTLDKAHEFTAALDDLAGQAGYNTREMGVYIQPLERARAVHMDFTIGYNPSNATEKENARKLFLSASEKVLNLGGFFTTPYGPWADLVYSRTTQYTAMLKLVKNAYDPNNIMNPGKLCF
jgi:FAD/FMN-containing dehydrogenase